MFVLIEYTDHVGRETRLAVDDDAWVRQEWRHGRWVTTERHPVKDLQTVLGESTSDADREQRGEVDARP